MRELRPLDWGVYLVTDTAQARSRGRSVAEVVECAVAGGVTVVQVRDKDASTAERVRLIRDVCDAAGDAAVIVNDDVDAYLQALGEGADVAGVHVGQGDAAPSLVRSRIGADAVLGLSANTPATVREASARDVTYLGVGPVNATTTKPDARAPLGVEGITELVGLTELPVVAIGGVGVADVAGLRGAGVAGCAVVSAICAAPDPEAAAAALAAEWAAHRGGPSTMVTRSAP